MLKVGSWQFSRPNPPHEMAQCRSRGLVVKWQQGDKYVASYPTPHTGWAWAWPWILYNTIRVMRQHRKDRYGI